MSMDINILLNVQYKQSESNIWTENRDSRAIRKTKIRTKCSILVTTSHIVSHSFYVLTDTLHYTQHSIQAQAQTDTEKPNIIMEIFVFFMLIIWF